MVVCHCKAVNDKAIRGLLADGRARSLEDIAARCGAGSRCGGCVPTICELVDGHRMAGSIGK
jgi:bacterioferritin-associated ferredoxin